MNMYIHIHIYNFTVLKACAKSIKLTLNHICDVLSWIRSHFICSHFYICIFFILTSMLVNLSFTFENHFFN